MAEIINLRQAKKQLERREKEDAAAAARAKHGQLKRDKQARLAAEKKARKELEAHKREGHKDKD
jgi:hypothetical protein